MRMIHLAPTVRTDAMWHGHETAWFPSVRAMVEADLRGWLPMVGVVLSEDQIVDILEQALSPLRSCVTADGALRFDIGAHIVTGTNGHAT